MKTFTLVLALVCAVLIQGMSYASQPKGKHAGARIRTLRNTKVVHPSGSVRPGIAVNQAPIRRQNVSAANPALARTVTPHRGSNPAVVGGTATSNAKNAAAISGTHMNRRHY